MEIAGGGQPERPRDLGVSLAVDDLRPMAQELVRVLQELLESIPGATQKPTALARHLGLNRVVVSKLLGALSKGDPFEAMQQLPGPDTLRTIVRAAALARAPRQAVREANRVVDGFAEMIRGHFGTRDALNAAISTQSSDNQKRFELASRYDVYKGMRQIVGVEAETWVTSMFFAPNPDDPDSIAITSIHGALAMRRLRPDAQMYFTFGVPSRGGEGDPSTSQPIEELSRSPVALQEFYTHEQAELETHASGGQLVHRFAGSGLGKHAIADMLAVSHNPRGSRRYAMPGRTKGGLAVTVDIPVKTMICDAIVHRDVFPGAKPELIVYKLGARGPANPNDPSRDIDRLVVPEDVESISDIPDRFELLEIPNYTRMLERVSAHTGYDLGEYSVHRLRMGYPVHGFQFTIAFEAPFKDEA